MKPFRPMLAHFWYIIFHLGRSQCRHCDLPVRLLCCDFGVTCKTLQRAIHHLSQETGFHSHFATKFAYFRQPYPLFPSLEDSFISIVRPYEGKLKKGGFHLYLFPFDYPFNYIENYVVSSGISSKSVPKMRDLFWSYLFWVSAKWYLSIGN